ncbi:hypothetical protein DQW13_00715 [Taylorella equigenitalis]|nr:hypothetical protein CA605_07340 [Taylorella equigenitalis]KGK33856.1 hypothetical protein LW90_02830 [Taylorella equigenitalis]RBA27001.1 hypothetical protein DQW13_00715 [Taylorella equigenitalis]
MSPYFSRILHSPEYTNSGVTIGRGYDLGERESQDVLTDLNNSGIPLAQAQIISNGVKFIGGVARSFVKKNRILVGEISHE